MSKPNKVIVKVNPRTKANEFLVKVTLDERVICTFYSPDDEYTLKNIKAVIANHVPRKKKNRLSLPILQRLNDTKRIVGLAFNTGKEANRSSPQITTIPTKTKIAVYCPISA